MTARPTHRQTREMPFSDSPQRTRGLSLRALLYAGMMLGGLGMMFAGVYGLQYADPNRFPLPTVTGTSRQQAVRTVCQITALLGCCLLCLGMLCASELGKRKQTKRRRSRVPRPAPASEQPFENRLAQYLDEQPTPAVRATLDSSRSFLLKLLPGPRRGPKSASAIRAILLRIHTLLRGGR